jgi:hypothetical protein
VKTTGKNLVAVVALQVASYLAWGVPIDQLFGATPSITIDLKHQSAAEVQTKQQLERLLAQYPLTPWYFTRSVDIDETAIPHSHPVLTLHTRHNKDDDLLLSTFVHEELHWFLAGQKEIEAAEHDLRVLFPKMPVGYSDGADSEESGYLHLLVNYLEWQSGRRLLGELRARQIMEFWAHDHYRWIYQTVLDHPDGIGKVISKYHLNFPEKPAK